VNRTFSVLRHRAFRWIWAASLVSNVGNWMEAVAQSWLVQQQTASPLMVELLAASEFVPHALLLLAAGALADRYDRRKLLLVGQIAMMVFGALLAVLTHLGHATPWVVIALAFAEGAAWAAVMPAWQALMPTLVPRDELPSAIALNSVQFNSARLIGPMLAGALLTATSAAVVFDINVVSFLAIVLVLGFIRLSDTRGGGPAPAHAGRGVGPALRWSVHEPGPRRLLLGLLAFALFAAPVQGLLPSMADEVLKVGAHGYGGLLSCFGTGAILGALTLAQLPRGYPRHHLIPLSTLAFSLCALVYASAYSILVAGAALVAGGVFWVWSLASASTAMQLLVPDHLRGRAMSVLALATTGPLPLGHLLGGWIAHALGVRAGVLLPCAALAVFSAWSVWARVPEIDAMKLPPPPPRGLRAAIWEALTAASHRAQEVEPGVPKGSAEPIEDG
jgi:MFS family permease